MNCSFVSCQFRLSPDRVIESVSQVERRGGDAAEETRGHQPVQESGEELGGLVSKGHTSFASQPTSFLNSKIVFISDSLRTGLFHM